MELYSSLIFIFIGSVSGGVVVWLFCRKSSENAVQKAIAYRETQRIQMETQLLFLKQKGIELATEITRRDKRIDELIAIRRQEIARLASLESQARRASELEELLVEVEEKLQKSYERLSSFAADDDLERCQETILEQMQAVRESLDRVNARISDLEISSASAFAGLEQQIRALAESKNFTFV
jgi:hypothetical protein